MDRIRKSVTDDYYYKPSSREERLYQEDCILKEPIKRYIADKAQANEFIKRWEYKWEQDQWIYLVDKFSGPQKRAASPSGEPTDRQKRRQAFSKSAQPVYGSWRDAVTNVPSRTGADALKAATGNETAKATGNETAHSRTEVDAARSAIEVDAARSHESPDAARSAIEVDAARSHESPDAARSAIEVDAARSAIEVEATRSGNKSVDDSVTEADAERTHVAIAITPTVVKRIAKPRCHAVDGNAKDSHEGLDSAGLTDEVLLETRLVDIEAGRSVDDHHKAKGVSDGSEVVPAVVKPSVKPSSTIWPVNLVPVFAREVVRLLLSLPENEGRNISVDVVVAMFESNTNYLELCKRLESLGFSLSHKVLAKTMLVVVENTTYGSNVVLPCSEQEMPRLVSEHNELEFLPDACEDVEDNYDDESMADEDTQDDVWDAIKVAPLPPPLAGAPTAPFMEGPIMFDVVPLEVQLQLVGTARRGSRRLIKEFCNLSEYETELKPRLGNINSLSAVDISCMIARFAVLAEHNAIAKQIFIKDTSEYDILGVGLDQYNICLRDLLALTPDSQSWILSDCMMQGLYEGSNNHWLSDSTIKRCMVLGLETKKRHIVFDDTFMTSFYANLNETSIDDRDGLFEYWETNDILNKTVSPVAVGIGIDSDTRQLLSAINVDMGSHWVLLSATWQEGDLVGDVEIFDTLPDHGKKREERMKEPVPRLLRLLSTVYPNLLPATWNAPVHNHDIIQTNTWDCGVLVTHGALRMMSGKRPKRDDGDRIRKTLLAELSRAIPVDNNLLVAAAAAAEVASPFQDLPAVVGNDGEVAPEDPTSIAAAIQAGDDYDPAAEFNQDPLEVLIDQATGDLLDDHDVPSVSYASCVIDDTMPDTARALCASVGEWGQDDNDRTPALICCLVRVSPGTFTKLKKKQAVADKALNLLGRPSMLFKAWANAHPRSIGAAFTELTELPDGVDPSGYVIFFPVLEESSLEGFDVFLGARSGTKGALLSKALSALQDRTLVERKLVLFTTIGLDGTPDLLDAKFRTALAERWPNLDCGLTTAIAKRIKTRQPTVNRGGVRWIYSNLSLLVRLGEEVESPVEEQDPHTGDPHWRMVLEWSLIRRHKQLYRVDMVAARAHRGRELVGNCSRNFLDMGIPTPKKCRYCPWVRGKRPMSKFTSHEKYCLKNPIAEPECICRKCKRRFSTPTSCRRHEKTHK